MIDATQELSISRQAALLAISHSNLYYLPQQTSEADLALMRRMDELHLNFPFAGSRMLRDMLRLEGHRVGREHVRTLMAKMGIHALYRGRNTSAPHPAHPIYQKWSRLFEQLSPIYKWIPGGLAKVQSCPRRRASLATNAKPRWATRGARGSSSYAAIFNCGKAARYFSSGVSRSSLECGRCVLYHPK